ncbi:MAG: VOC family protein [Jiangellaceae bacterium]
MVFELDGKEFVALDGGPEFTFNEAISLEVNCQTQAELDRLWETLSEGSAGAVRLAEGQVRRVVADRPDSPERAGG